MGRKGVGVPLTRLDVPYIPRFFLRLAPLVKLRASSEGSLPQRYMPTRFLWPCDSDTMGHGQDKGLTGL